LFNNLNCCYTTRLEVIIFGSVRFLHKKINQTDIINFKTKTGSNRLVSVRFSFCCSKTGKTEKKISVPSVHKLQVNLQANLSFCCSRKQICPVSTNYKQISMSSTTNYKQISVSIVQEHKSAHKLQANYNLIIKKTKTHKMQTAKMNLKWS
jgi:hypothetical protein